MAISPNDTFTSGQILTAQECNNFPFGIVAKGQNPSNTGLTTTVGDFNVSVTFTAIANRYYKYTFYAYASNSTTVSTLETYITDSSNNIKATLNMASPGNSNYTYQMLTYITTETAGSVTRKVRGKCGAGTGTVYGPLDLWVEDIGPA